MNNPVWKDQTVTLIKLLQRDSGNTTQVLVQMITHAQHAALVDQYGAKTTTTVLSTANWSRRAPASRIPTSTPW